MAKPKIRFKGYTDDWEQRKFSEFVKNVAVRNKAGVELECYAVTNDRGFISQKEAHDDFGYMADVDTTAYNIVPPSSFAYNPARINVGSIGYYTGTENVIVSSLYEVFQTADYVDDRFMWHWFKSDHFPKWIERLQEGSVRLYFYYDKLIQCEMKMPSLEEQKKMGAFFDQLDHLITLHQCKCHLLLKLLHNDWEQRKFSDIATRESSVCTSASDIPSVEYEDVVAEEGRLNKDIHSKEVAKVGITFDGSQVLYGKLRPYLHNWLNPDFKGIAVGDWWVLKPVNMDKNFLYRLIQTQQFDNVANQSSGSKMPRADWKLISSSEFMLPPSKEEQSKIGGYFDQLDHLITLHHRKYIYILKSP